MGEIYFDNSSTTKVCPEAASRIMDMLTNNYGNPSSLHTKGFKAEQQQNCARNEIASFLNVYPEEIYFTSGGTESNNIAIFGAVHSMRKRGNHIVTTAIEHPSVLNVMKQLEKEGFMVTYLKPDINGKIYPEQVFKAVTPRTILVSMMYVNNEVGSILPIESVPSAISAAKSPALFHVDAVQAFGKLPINPNKFKIDLMSMSSHKIHGSKGVGALYMKKGVHIVPRTYGGGQERNIRPGTEATPLIVGFGAAVKALPNFSLELKEMEKLNSYCRQKLNEIQNVKINSPDDALPYIINFSAGTVRAETMLHFMSSKEIYVSSGSACSKGKASYVLTSMGLSKQRIISSLRISFSRYNNIEEIDTFIDALKEGLNKITKRPI